MVIRMSKINLKMISVMHSYNAYSTYFAYHVLNVKCCVFHDWHYAMRLIAPSGITIIYLFNVVRFEQTKCMIFQLSLERTLERMSVNQLFMCVCLFARWIACMQRWPEWINKFQWFYSKRTRVCHLTALKNSSFGCSRMPEIQQYSSFVSMYRTCKHCFRFIWLCRDTNDFKLNVHPKIRLIAIGHYAQIVYARVVRISTTIIWTDAAVVTSWANPPPTLVLSPMAYAYANERWYQMSPQTVHTNAN